MTIDCPLIMRCLRALLGKVHTALDITIRHSQSVREF
jgi:hypothetical protein